MVSLSIFVFDDGDTIIKGRGHDGGGGGGGCGGGPFLAIVVVAAPRTHAITYTIAFDVRR